MIDPETTLPEKKLVAMEGVAAVPLGDRLAVLNLDNSTYYTMNPVAAAIWDHLASPQYPADLVRGVREQFDVGEADVASDVAKVLSDLTRLKLIRVADA